MLRFSAGRYAQEPETYQVQYNAKDNNLAYDLFQAFWQYGYTTPRHIALVQYSDNYDSSYERRFKGTDMSIKVTPYYRYATNQVYSIAPAVRPGRRPKFRHRTRRRASRRSSPRATSTRTGSRSVISYTYTNAAERWANYPGTSINPIDPYNQDIANFNGLTRPAAARNATKTIASATSFPIRSACITRTIIRRSGTRTTRWRRSRCSIATAGIPSASTFAYLSPNVATAIVNYKHNRFWVTPALQFNEGRRTGTRPTSTVTIRDVCTNNSAGFINSPIHTKNPLQADYTTCVLGRNSERNLTGRAVHSQSGDRARSITSAPSGSRVNSTSACSSAISSRRA